jgi:hypothetical protein
MITEVKSYQNSGAIQNIRNLLAAKIEKHVHLKHPWGICSNRAFIYSNRERMMEYFHCTKIGANRTNNLYIGNDSVHEFLYHSRKIDLTHECVLLIHHQKDLTLRTQIYGLLQIAEIPVDMNKAASKFHKLVDAPT